jgi:hypothetical protein
LTLKLQARKKSKPVRHRIHICKVEYQDIQNGGGCDIITRIVAHKGSRLYDYGLTLLNRCVIVKHASPKIVDAP